MRALVSIHLIFTEQLGWCAWRMGTVTSTVLHNNTACTVARAGNYSNCCRVIVSSQRIVLWRSYRLAYVDKLVSYVLNLAITKNSFPLPRMIHIYWFASEKRGHRRRGEAFMNNYIDRARESESRNLLLERRDQLAQRRVGRESRVRQRLVRDGRRVVRGQPFLDGSALVAVAVRAPARRT